MPGLSPQQSSFIPKRNSGVDRRQPRQSTFFILGIISYACLMAAPTGSAAVYVYQLYTNKQYETSVNELNQEIGKFNTADMNRVLEYDQRFTIIKTILGNHVSLDRALAVLEANTAETVAFTTLTMRRTGREVVSVESELITDSIDALIYQRQTYQGLTSLASSSISGIKFTPGTASTTRSVVFSGKFLFKADNISFIPDGQATSTSTGVEATATTTDSAVTPITSTTTTNSTTI